MAHERLTEPRLTMKWLLAKPRSFLNLPAFSDLNGSVSLQYIYNNIIPVYFFSKCIPPGELICKLLFYYVRVYVNRIHIKRGLCDRVKELYYFSGISWLWDRLAGHLENINTLAYESFLQILSPLIGKIFVRYISRNKKC